MREMVWLIVETVGSLLATACVLRLWMVWLGLGLRDPVGHFVFTFTEWLVRPLRAIAPRRGHLDVSCLLAAMLLSVVLAAIFVLLFSLRTPSFGSVVLLAVVWLARWALWLMIGALLLQVILSWVNPQAPIAPMLHMLTEPLLAPVQRRLPRLGGIDLSPLILMLLGQIGLSLLQALQPAL